MFCCSNRDKQGGLPCVPNPNPNPTLLLANKNQINQFWHIASYIALRLINALREEETQAGRANSVLGLSLCACCVHQKIRTEKKTATFAQILSLAGTPQRQEAKSAPIEREEKKNNIN